MASEIVAKQLTGDCIIHTISYDAGTDCGPVAGMSLTGGKPITSNGVSVVRFDQKFKGQVICIKYDTRPDLASLVAEYNSIEAAKQAEQDARWAAKQAEQDAIDQPLLDAMHAKADMLRSQIPVDHVEVSVTKTGDLDGDPILEYIASGVKLNWQDVIIIGWVSAIRPGALGALAEICIASISKDRLEQIKATQARAVADKKVTQVNKELTETEIPQYAIESYNRYNGSSEAAWENEDETAWALIERWTPYIEAQWDRESNDNETRETTVEIDGMIYVVKRETVIQVYACSVIIDDWGCRAQQRR